MITKQALGSLLFGMADILRDKVEDYKSYILSLLFFSSNVSPITINGKSKTKKRSSSSEKVVNLQ